MSFRKKVRIAFSPPDPGTALYFEREQIELLESSFFNTKGQRVKGLSLNDFLCPFDPLTLCVEKAQSMP
ncbi:MAG: hypothetical protein ACRD9Y_27875, partial [Blastocatellia bacterium]